VLIREEVTVKVQPEQVWALLSDLDRHAEWNPHILATEVYGVGGVALGTRYRVTYRLSGTSTECDAEVVEFAPPRRFAARLEERVKGDGSQFRRFMVESYDVIPVRLGTHVVHEVRIDFSGVPFFLRALVWFIVRTGHPVGPTTMEKFGQLLEAEARGGRNTASA